MRVKVRVRIKARVYIPKPNRNLKPDQLGVGLGYDPHGPACSLIGGGGKQWMDGGGARMVISQDDPETQLRYIMRKIGSGLGGGRVTQGLAKKSGDWLTASCWAGPQPEGGMTFRTPFGSRVRLRGRCPGWRATARAPRRLYVPCEGPSGRHPSCRMETKTDGD